MGAQRAFCVLPSKLQHFMPSMLAWPHLSRAWHGSWNLKHIHSCDVPARLPCRRPAHQSARWHCCRGMGWQEGRAIGRSGKGEVIAKELVRRPQRLGLGATPAAETNQKKYIKPGELPSPFWPRTCLPSFWDCAVA